MVRTPMGTTRRNVLGATAAVPLLARFAETASAADGDRYGRVSDGWVEVRWAPLVREELDRLGAVVRAVAPARLVEDAHGSAIRFPVNPVKGDPSPESPQRARGDGGLQGGVAVRTPIGNLRLTHLTGVLEDGLASGRCTINGLEVEHHPAFRCGLTEGRLITEPTRDGGVMRVRMVEVPLRPTAEALEVYTATFGAPALTVDTVLAHVTAEGLYTPPRR
ncbi:hypothetical protein [Streptomyces sp. ST2-7A]|uniref:hypothetical protein n=1 Tax=Streptomyces sp. ST2-7A TaxID=2907214 RepID=UPI001F3F3250|nr:hypothetical protein [Streptomyces sp. ST2-7A]MCE7079543.1 hypothetical protein [Streptomyces sp. ST2-7A]